jgi:hypothetical protein
MNTMEEFLRHGKETEKRFCETLTKNGYGFEVSTPNQDMLSHWDVAIIWESDPTLVDVKGMKKITRLDPEPNENFHWVELVNVTGKWGWLYGAAEDFAFETEDYWLIVSKEKLQSFIKKKCSKEMVTKSTDALYKMYQREGRKDIMTLVKTMDLIVELKPTILKK